MTRDARGAAETWLVQRIEARQAVCGALGLGFIGSTLMDAMVHAGFRAIGFDRSCEAARGFDRWMAARAPEASERWSTASDPAELARADVIAVAVRVLPRDDGSVNLEPLENAAAILRALPAAPRLILVETTVPCGMTRCFAASLGSRPDVFVAHSPERLSVGHDRDVFRRVPHLAGGTDAAAGRVGAAFLRTLCEQVVVVSSPEVSELSKLLENAFLTTGIALSNEAMRMAHAMGIAAEEVCAAAATKPFGYFPFYPGPGMGGHCLGNDLSILLCSAQRFGVESAYLNAVAETSAQGPRMVVRRFEDLLHARGRNLPRQRILLVGVGFKPGTSDTTGSPAREIARLLQESGAEVCYLDSLVPEFAVDGRAIERVDSEGLQACGVDAAIVVAGDRDLSLERLAACSDLVFDARGRCPEVRPESVQIL